MRSRFITGMAALVFAVSGLLVPTNSASAHCGGHGVHPDLYSAGGISFKSGTRIRTQPHTGCTVRGLGYPGHLIDVHCIVETGTRWLFVRDTSTGVNGWARWDALDYSQGGIAIRDCNSTAVAYQLT